MENRTEFEEREKKEIETFALVSGGLGFLFEGFAYFSKDKTNKSALASAGALLVGTGFGLGLAKNKIARIDGNLAVKNGYALPDPPDTSEAIASIEPGKPQLSQALGKLS